MRGTSYAGGGYGCEGKVGGEGKAGGKRRETILERGGEGRGGGGGGGKGGKCVV